MQLRTGALILILSLVPASTALAQPSAFVGALGGLTFNTVSSGAVAGQAGIRVAPGIFVVGEFGHMHNVLPKELADQIDDAELFFEDQLGVPVSLSIRAPALYGWGGVRWSPPGDAGIRPFLEAGVGFGRVEGKIKASIAGAPVPQRIVKDVLEQFDVDVDTTELLLALGGGVNLRLTGRISVDAGYRYTRIATDDPAVNASMVYAAVKLGLGGR